MMIKRLVTDAAALVLSCVVASTVVAISAGHARASTIGAASRCFNHQADDARALRVIVPGNGAAFVGGGPRQALETPLRNQIMPGDVVAVAATGRVSYGGFFGSAGTWGPDGNGHPAPASASYPFPGGPQYGLAGTWNHSGDDNPIGSVSPCLVVPSGGDGVSIPWGLWLLPNDDDPTDNGGSYTADVHVWRAALSP
jgi:hypothetical protein